MYNTSSVKPSLSTIIALKQHGSYTPFSEKPVLRFKMKITCNDRVGNILRVQTYVFLWVRSLRAASSSEMHSCFLQSNCSSGALFAKWLSAYERRSIRRYYVTPLRNGSPPLIVWSSLRTHANVYTYTNSSYQIAQYSQIHDNTRLYCY